MRLAAALRARVRADNTHEKGGSAKGRIKVSFSLTHCDALAHSLSLSLSLSLSHTQLAKVIAPRDCAARIYTRGSPARRPVPTPARNEQRAISLLLNACHKSPRAPSRPPLPPLPSRRVFCELFPEAAAAAAATTTTTTTATTATPCNSSVRRDVAAASLSLSAAFLCCFRCLITRFPRGSLRQARRVYNAGCNLYLKRSELWLSRIFRKCVSYAKM